MNMGQVSNFRNTHFKYIMSIFLPQKDLNDVYWSKKEIPLYGILFFNTLPAIVICW